VFCVWFVNSMFLLLLVTSSLTITSNIESLREARQCRTPFTQNRSPSRLQPSLVFIFNFFFYGFVTIDCSFRLCLFFLPRLYLFQIAAHCCQCCSPALHYSLSSEFSIVLNLIRLTFEP